MIADDLAIAGFVPFSTCDWPGKLVATLFLQGCPWDCGYCHNPSLIDPRAPGLVRWSQVRATLDRRMGLLDGVVFSGGEPTRQAGLVNAVAEVREMGFGAALHTSGAYPSLLARLLPNLQWVGLDIKAPYSKYAAVTGVETRGEKPWASLDLLVASGVPYEVRLTVDPTVLTLADVEEVIAEVERRGGSTPVLQEVRAEGARPEYAAVLGLGRLHDIVPLDALPGVERRLAHASASSAGTSPSP